MNKKTNNQNKSHLHPHDEIISPGWFAHHNSDGKWKFARHLQYLDKALVGLINGDFSRLMVNMPPRHGKSELISKYFPAWYLTKYPDKRIILTSYSKDFASKWGRLVRDIINDRTDKGKSELKLARDNRSANIFSIREKGGTMVSTGAGCSITGRGADLLIIDDPIKNSDAAMSKKIPGKIWDWFIGTAMTRLEPGGKAVLLMTRWHDDDLCGKILQSANIVSFRDAMSGVDYPDDIETWIKLTLPALAPEEDELGRMPGEALWRERYDEAELLRIKVQSGAFWFASLYQQDPIPGKHCIFKREHFSYFTEDDKFYHLKNHRGEEISRLKDTCLRFASVDLGLSTSKQSDYTAIVTFALTQYCEVLILDVLRLRVAPEYHQSLIASHIDKWQLNLTGIEDVAYQRSLINILKLKGYNIKSLKPSGSKTARARIMQTRLEDGSVYFSRNASWLGDFEEELMRFPDVKHDDQADAFSYIGLMLSGEEGALVKGTRKPEKIGNQFN